MSLTGKTVRDLPEITNKVAATNGDLGLVRLRIDKGDKDFRKYGYNSIIFDGVSTNTFKTGGIPPGYPFDRVVFPTPNGTGYTLYFASSSTEDNSGGTGATKVFISGLDGNWLEQTEEITLNGQTPVATTKDNWLRVNRLTVSDINSNGQTNVGNIACSEVNSFTSGVPDQAPVNLIPVNFGYSVIGIFSVPKNKRLYFTRGLI